MWRGLTGRVFFLGPTGEPKMTIASLAGGTGELIVPITRLPGMTTEAFRAKALDALRKECLDTTKIDDHVFDQVFWNDTLVFRFPKHLMLPYPAKFSICLFEPRQQQEKTLAEYADDLKNIWIPTCGRWSGRLICILRAIGVRRVLIALIAIAGWIRVVCR